MLWDRKWLVELEKRWYEPSCRNCSTTTPRPNSVFAEVFSQLTVACRFGRDFIGCIPKERLAIAKYPFRGHAQFLNFIFFVFPITS
jgi:hypothetical protein